MSRNHITTFRAPPGWLTDPAVALRNALCGNGSGTRWNAGRQSLHEPPGVGDRSTAVVVVEVGVDVAALVEPRARAGRPRATVAGRRSGRRTSARARSVRGSARRSSPWSGSTDGRSAGRGCTVPRRAARARRTRRRAATSDRAARPPTAGRAAPRSRNSSRRPALRRQRGGSCTSVGPSARRRAARARSRWFGSHDAASRSFMRCEPNAPSFSAYTNPGGAWAGPLLDGRRRRQPVEGVVDLDGVEPPRSSRTTRAAAASGYTIPRQSRYTHPEQPIRTSPLRETLTRFQRVHAPGIPGTQCLEPRQRSGVRR